MNRRPSASKLAAVLNTLLEDMKRLWGLGRFWNDGKATNVVFETTGESLVAYCIDFGAAIRKEDVMLDALVGFGSVTSGPRPPVGMDALNAVPGLTPGFCLKGWLDRQIPKAAGECWRELIDFEGTEEEVRSVISALGDQIESALKRNDAFAFAMTALWCVVGPSFYQKIGGVYLGEMIANQALHPTSTGFSEWDLFQKPLLLSTNHGVACGLPAVFQQFIAKQSCYATLQLEFDQDQLEQEVAVVIKALLAVADAQLESSKS